MLVRLKDILLFQLIGTNPTHLLSHSEEMQEMYHNPNMYKSAIGPAQAVWQFLLYGVRFIFSLC